MPSTTVQNTPEWLDGPVTVEAGCSYLLFDEGDGSAVEVYLTGVGRDVAYGVEAESPGRLIRLDPVSDLVATGRLVPSETAASRDDRG